MAVGCKNAFFLIFDIYHFALKIVTYVTSYTGYASLVKFLFLSSLRLISAYAAQKMKFSIKDFFSKCDQIRSFLKKFSVENFIFCAVFFLIRSISFQHFLRETRIYPFFVYSTLISLVLFVGIFFPSRWCWTPFLIGLQAVSQYIWGKGRFLRLIVFFLEQPQANVALYDIFS